MRRCSTIKLMVFQFSPRLEDYPRCEGSAGNCGVPPVFYEHLFHHRGHGDNVDVHADAPRLSAGVCIYRAFAAARGTRDDQASNPWLFTFRVTLGRKLRRRILMRQPPMLHLGQWIIDVEWKKGPRPAVAAPTSPVKFDQLFLAGRP